MKRYISIDFLRGVAIQLMLVLHMFMETYNINHLVDTFQSGEGSIGLIILLGIILYFASFAGFFITISGFSNFISMHKRHGKMIKEAIEHPYRIIRREQLKRGLLILFIGEFVNAILWPYVLKPILYWLEGKTFVYEWKGIVDELFWFNVIPFLGLAIIIVGFIYSWLIKRKSSLKQMSKILWILIFSIWIVTPFILYGIRTIPEFWPSPYSDWSNKNPGTVVLFLFLGPIAGKTTPLFPWIVAFLLGTVISIDLQRSPISKKFVRKWVLIGVCMFIVGLILQGAFALVAESLEDVARDRFEAGFGTIFGIEGRSTPYMLFVGGGEILIITLFFWMVEGKHRATKFARNTIFFRRSGMISLTIFSLQALSLFPIFAMEKLLGLEFRANQETIGQSFLIIFVSMIILNLLWWLWQKANFVGTFEWFSALVLGGSKKGMKQRINPTEILYNVEPMGEPPKIEKMEGSEINTG